MSLASLAEGFLLKLAALIFIAGLAARVLFVLIRRSRGPHSTALKSPVLGAAISQVNWVVPRPGFLRRNPARTALAIALHAALFGILLFEPCHNVYIWEELLGTSWEPFSSEAADILSIIAALALAALLADRLFRRTVRAVSKSSDYFTTGLLEAIVITGYAASHSYGPEAMHEVHMLLAEAFLIYAPFGKIGHAVTFFIARALHGAESARRGVTP